MTSGMAHVSGGIMAAYIAFGVEAKHLLAAVIMTAPGTILLAKMLVPETGTPETAGTVKLSDERVDANVIGAAARGTSEGLHLALNVAAMLISFLSLVALVNLLLGKLGGLAGVSLSLQSILGYAFMPLALVMGVPWKDAFVIGDLLGTRMVLNELIAYSQARRAEGDARPAHLHDRHLRALRLRQLQLDRDPDRRHRRARARAQAGPGAARPARAARRHLRQLPDRLHRRSAAVSERLRRLDEAAGLLRSRTPLQPAMGIILGSGLGAFADSLEGAVSVPYARDPALPRLDRGGPRRRARDRPLPGRAGRRDEGARALLRGLLARAGGVPGSRAGPAGDRNAAGDERRGRRQHEVRARRPDGDRGPHQPARQPAHRPERGRARRALHRHERGLRPRPARRGRGRLPRERRARAAGRLPRAHGAQPSRRPRRSACSARSARTRSACRRCPR